MDERDCVVAFDDGPVRLLVFDSNGRDVRQRRCGARGEAYAWVLLTVRKTPDGYQAYQTVPIPAPDEPEDLAALFESAFYALDYYFHDTDPEHVRRYQLDAVEIP